MNGLLSRQRIGCVEVRQFDVLKQYHPYNCGFYAMYNALCYDKYQIGRTDDNKDLPDAFVHEMKDNCKFWRFFWRFWRELCDVESMGPKLKIISEMVEGDMDKAVALLGKQNNLHMDCIHSASWQSIFSCVSDPKDVEHMHVFVKNASMDPGIPHLCVVGVAGHWVTYAIKCSVDSETGDKTAHVDIMDSQGIPLCDSKIGWESCIRKHVEQISTSHNSRQNLQKNLQNLQLSFIS